MTVEKGSAIDKSFSSNMGCVHYKLLDSDQNSKLYVLYVLLCTLVAELSAHLGFPFIATLSFNLSAELVARFG